MKNCFGMQSFRHLYHGIDNKITNENCSMYQYEQLCTSFTINNCKYIKKTVISLKVEYSNKDLNLIENVNILMKMKSLCNFFAYIH